jgi:hypothetical protein
MKDFTSKERKVIEEFSKIRPSLGEIAQQNIRNNAFTGWADIIADMKDEDIKIQGSKGVSHG